MRQIALCCLAAFTTFCSGWIYRDRMGLWGNDKSLEKAAARLVNVPKEFGDWRGVDRELDERQLVIGEVTSAIAREYVDRLDRHRFQIVLLCGRPGPISVHTPDICYDANGYKAVTLPEVVDVIGTDGSRAQVWRVGFRPKRADRGEELRVAWTWSDSGPWSAPENPRVTYAPRRFLYKLYVVQQGVAGRQDDKGLVDFLKDFLPVVAEALEIQGDPENNTVLKRD